MSQAPHRRLILFAALSVIPVVTSTQSVDRIIYASVLDRSGRPVTPVVATDLIVRENNIDRAVVQVDRATDRFDIAVLVDTSQDAEAFISDFRRGLVEFVRAIGDRHEIAFMSFGQRSRTLIDYTHDPTRLLSGVGGLVVSRGSGAYLMDTLVDASLDLQIREHPRREVVVITSEGREFSERASTEVVGEVLRSGVSVDAFVVVGTRQGVGPAFESGPPRLPSPAVAQEQSDVERAAVLDEVIKRTNGRRENLPTSGMLGEKLRDLAARLNNQYRVTYDAPPRLTPPASIEIVTRRPDLRVRVMGIPQNRP
jgi:hypothetical protein